MTSLDLAQTTVTGSIFSFVTEYYFAIDASAYGTAPAPASTSTFREIYVAKSTIFESAVTETITMSLVLGDGIWLPLGATATSAVDLLYLTESVTTIAHGTGAPSETAGALTTELAAVTSLGGTDYGSLQGTPGASSSSLAAGQQ